MKQNKSKKRKQPQIGGAAAAAWEHHLTPEAKEELRKDYDEELKRKHNMGKHIVYVISAANFLLAHVSIFVFAYFNITAFTVQVVLSIFTFFVLPGTKIVFIIGAALVIFFSQGGWAISPDYSVFRVIFTAFNTVFLVLSAISLFASQTISDYLYAKRYG